MLRMIRIEERHLEAMRYRLLRYPRELDGFVVEAMERTLDSFGPMSDPAAFVEGWYRDATVASYESRDAAIAYLGAYGPRSALKYIEAILGLLAVTREIDDVTSVVDWGAGPSPGFAACVTVWHALREVMSLDIGFNYVAVEPSVCMREVGEAMARRLSTSETSWATFASGSEIGEPVNASILLVANVANEGEGIYDVARFIGGVLESGLDPEHIVSIEPATPGPSRQMCSLQRTLSGYRHVGPCPSGTGDCKKWVYRTIEKRVYGFERHSLGRWGSAASVAKYSLALLSRTASERPDCHEVVVEHRGGLATLCARAATRRVRAERALAPWDCASNPGARTGVWP